MEKPASKPRGRPRKVEQDDDDVRVILEDDDSEDASEAGLPYLGMMRGALWT